MLALYLDVSGRSILKHFIQKGADSEGTQLVCFGANCADPHHSGDSTVLKAGDSVIFDIFTPINRYWCDMTRTVFYKTVTDRQCQVYDLVKLANETAISSMVYSWNSIATRLF